MRFKLNQKAFTLVELLIVIGIIMIIAVIVFLLIDPAQRYSETRNTGRAEDVRSIADAVQKYKVDNDGDVPTGVDQDLKMLGTGSNCDIACGAAFQDGAGTFNDNNELDFDGVLSNVEWSNPNSWLQLEIGETEGTYVSSTKDAGGSTTWNIISWSEDLPTDTEEIIYHDVGEIRNYYRNAQYTVRNWFNTSGGFSSVTASIVLDCNGSCSGDVRVRIGNATTWTDYDFIDASSVTNGDLNNYNFYENTYDVSSDDVGDYFFVQLLLFQGSGDLRFMMDELGPAGPDPEFRSVAQGNGDGGQGGWQNDNGDYFIKVNVVQDTDLQFQVRTGVADPPTGDFLGPDGTPSTYYATAGGESLNVADNQYFQYKSYFDTDNVNITPGLSSVSIEYTMDAGDNENTETDCLDLSGVMNYYLPAIPFDPKYGDDAQTYYAIQEIDERSILVRSCRPELEADIELIR